MSTADVDMAGITRIKVTCSWWVRWCYIKDMPTFEKQFADEDYGDDKSKALIAAVMYRDEAKNKTIKDCVWPQSRKRDILTRRNNTGISSVFRLPQRGIINGKRQLTGNYEYVGAYREYSEKIQGTKLKNFSFSEKKWTPRGALYMAWASMLARKRIENLSEALQIVKGHCQNHEETWQAEEARVASLPKE
jgi:hypothetical protein